jgi:hypothetical protein
MLAEGYIPQKMDLAQGKRANSRGISPRFFPGRYVYPVKNPVNSGLHGVQPATP